MDEKTTSPSPEIVVDIFGVPTRFAISTEDPDVLVNVDAVSITGDMLTISVTPESPTPKPVRKKAVKKAAAASRYTPAEAAARYPKGLEKVRLRGGQEIMAHARGSCALYWCAIHYPSPHHMSQWFQVWISEEQRMYRICPEHLYEHPDPDDLTPGNPQDFRCRCTCRCCEREFDINSET